MASEQMIKFWWRFRSQIRIRIWIQIQIRIVTLVRCALAEVCTVPVLLVYNDVGLLTCFWHSTSRTCSVFRTSSFVEIVATSHRRWQLDSGQYASDQRR